MEAIIELLLKAGVPAAPLAAIAFVMWRFRGGDMGSSESDAIRVELATLTRDHSETRERLARIEGLLSKK